MRIIGNAKLQQLIWQLVCGTDAVIIIHVDSNEQIDSKRPGGKIPQNQNDIKGTRSVLKRARSWKLSLQLKWKKTFTVSFANDACQVLGAHKMDYQTNSNYGKGYKYYLMETYHNARLQNFIWHYHNTIIIFFYMKFPS